MSSRSVKVRWLKKDRVLVIHEAQIARHGGATGLRDPGLLESALARPKNAFEYENAPIPKLAALYALGVIKNHPFVDGNKRTATVLLEMFLRKNRYHLDVPDDELLAMILGVAASEVKDEEFVTWVRDRSHLL